MSIYFNLIFSLFSISGSLCHSHFIVCHYIKLRLQITCFRLAIVLILFLFDSSAMPQFTHFYDNNRFSLLWRFDDQNDKMFYHVRVKTTGWVGFGFSETAPNNMVNYDVIVGGFSNGTGYLHVSFYFIYA